MKHTFFMLLFAFFVSTNCHEKYVIGCEHAGLFSNFFYTLNHLAWCDHLKNKTPVIYWDNHSAYFMPEGYNGSLNVWEYYFEPVSSLAYEPGDFIQPNQPEQMTFVITRTDQEDRYAAQKIIDKYVILKPSIQQKIDTFYNTTMKGKKTIGIHLRGTDKWTEVKPVNPQDILAYANTFEGYQYLVATDEYRLLEMAKSVLKGHVIYYECQRSYNEMSLHNGYNKNHKARAGEEAIIEMHLLARCDIFIHTFSSMSSMVLFFNPDLNHILFGDMQYYDVWFENWVLSHPEKATLLKMPYKRIKELYLSSIEKNNL